MSDAWISENMSPELLKVVERARREPEARFHSLAHLIDVPALERSYRGQRKNAAAGVDGVTKERYGEALSAKLSDLHERMKTMRYRHRPLRRVYVPKGPNQTRPIGVSVFEDKIVQDALREVLEAVYEQDFLECSHGFRPKRRAHDAVRALDRAVHQGKVNWVLEADIVSFFDSLDRTKLKEMLQVRIADGSLLRLIGKCLHVGVLEGEEYHEPEDGTTQGSVLSPLLGNVYLHYTLDVWFEREVKPQLQGAATLIRYADDFVIAMERSEEAQQVMGMLRERLGQYGLTLHPQKTRLVEFGRPSANHRGKAAGTFDFLGFTFYWGQGRWGTWRMRCKTRHVRLRGAIHALAEWCRGHRHRPIKEQHAALKRRLVGHFNYFGVNGNFRSLSCLVEQTKRVWFKWLRRRGQRRPLSWERFGSLLKRYPLPKPRITVRIWASAT
jgi:group II intron reverse transcriptase/maturase